MIGLKSHFAATCLLVIAVVFAGCSIPTATPTVAATATPTATATAVPTAIVAPTATATLAPTRTPLPTPTPLPTRTPTPAAIATPTPGPATVPTYTYEVIAQYPHDADAFTQGLVYDNGVLYEGTGLYGKSSLRKARLDTGAVLQRHELAAELFGEGIAVYGDNRDRIVQLTWRNQTGFVYNKNTFQLLRTFSYPTEGWGITYDGRRLIMSDGTATLRFLDPDTLAETGSIQVRDGNALVDKLNELEYVEGTIYANVWLTDRIVIISPDTGAVVGRIDLKGLVDSLGTANHDVLNGIAYDPAAKRLFVTGKLWPKLFEIKLIPQI